MSSNNGSKFAVIAWYAKCQFEKVSSMSIDIATMRENGKDMKEDVSQSRYSPSLN